MIPVLMRNSFQNQRILIAEDDPSIGIGLEELFASEGFQVERVTKGIEVLKNIEKFKPHLLILDVMLPGKDGISICRDLREVSPTLPVLMLTAKGEELDKVRGLDVGADDYMTKPFGVRELLARVQALFRRYTLTIKNSDITQKSNALFQVGDAQVNPKTFEITLNGIVVGISSKELKLLQCFHAHQGEVLSRDQLLDEVWGYNYSGNTRTLDQVVVKLRRLIGEPEGKPKHLKTIHGTGYKLVNHSDLS